MNIEPGRWYQLKATLSMPAGTYRVSRVKGDTVVVSGRKHTRHTLSRKQFENLLQFGAPRPSTHSAPVQIPHFEQGMLSACGYRVGMSGLPASQRRSILQQLMETPAERLPLINTEEYRASWGQANTYERLKRIVRDLRSFASSSSLRANPADVAIDNWRSDEHWLLDKYRDLDPTWRLLDELLQDSEG